MTINCTNKKEIRRVQALTGERSLTFILPKNMATELGINKGDYLSCFIIRNKLILEKMDVK